MIDKQTLIDVGFLPPPPPSYTKSDPRGAEYGHFRATIETSDACVGHYRLPSGMTEQLIQVKKLNTDGHALYTMFFPSAESFKAWAKEEF